MFKPQHILVSVAVGVADDSTIAERLVDDVFNAGITSKAIRDPYLACVHVLPTKHDRLALQLSPHLAL